VTTLAVANAPAVDNAGGASNITTNSATLNGTLTSTGGAPITVYFFYGTNDGGAAWDNWGYTNNRGGLGGATNVPAVFTDAISGFSAATKYYYRFYATNSAGQNWATPVTNFWTANSQSTGGTSIVTNETRIAASSDDARENVSDGVVKTSSAELDMVDHPTAGNQILGFRFPNLAIPNGATITLAYIQFTASNTNSTNTAYTIRAETNDNCATFTSNIVHNISARFICSGFA